MMVKFGNQDISLNYRIIARKAIGASHKKKGIVNQDSYKVINTNEISIIAVADGHGNEKCIYKNIGSKKAVNCFCDQINISHHQYPNLNDFKEFLFHSKSNLLPRNLVRCWQKSIKDDFERKTKGKKTLLESSEIFELYGTTLLGLVLFDNYFFSIQIGDGDIISIFDDSSSKHINEVERILGVETLSLSSKFAINQFTSTLGNIHNGEKPIEGFFLSTDGLSNSFINNDEFLKISNDYLDLIKKFGFEYLNNRMGNYLSETSIRGSGDDITLVIAMKQN
ncbi:MAG: protein phosphatase 2C domain-containing protein [Bacteroidetes bacterium]|nr:protein phosphatase 2C domain-containing protein [Bacteroidota bacterium]